MSVIKEDVVATEYTYWDFPPLSRSNSIQPRPVDQRTVL